MKCERQPIDSMQKVNFEVITVFLLEQPSPTFFLIQKTKNVPIARKEKLIIL